MRQKKGFTLREVCGEKVIMAEGAEVVNFSHLCSVSNSAALLWEYAAELGDFTDRQLAQKLCDTYDVDDETALADVRILLAQWQELGIVE